MAALVNNHLVLENIGVDIEMYLNDSNEIFATAAGDDGAMFWFVINKDDWEVMKDFIDGELNAAKK